MPRPHTHPKWKVLLCRQPYAYRHERSTHTILTDHSLGGKAKTMRGWKREEVYSYGRLAARQSWTAAGGTLFQARAD